MLCPRLSRNFMKSLRYDQSLLFFHLIHCIRPKTHTVDSTVALALSPRTTYRFAVSGCLNLSNNSPQCRLMSEILSPFSFTVRNDILEDGHRIHIMLAVRLHATGKILHQCGGFQGDVFIFSVPRQRFRFIGLRGASCCQSCVKLRVEVGKTHPRMK